MCKHWIRETCLLKTFSKTRIENSPYKTSLLYRKCSIQKSDQFYNNEKRVLLCLNLLLLKMDTFYALCLVSFTLTGTQDFYYTCCFKLVYMPLIVVSIVVLCVKACVYEVINADVVVISGVTSAQIQLQVAASHTVANEGETIDFVCRVTNAKYGDLIYLTKQVINDGEAPVSVRPPQPHRV